jgi:signal transduction histidine kinase
VRLSIRYKILGVLGVLLALSVVFYTLLASNIFRQEKVALVYDINHSLAVNIASQLRSTLTDSADRVKLYVLSEMMSPQSGVHLSPKYLGEANLKGVQVFRIEGNNFVTQGLPSEPVLNPPPAAPATALPYLKEALSTGESFWSEANEGEEPRFFLATRIALEWNGKPVSYVATAQLESKPLFAVLQSANLFDAYLINRSSGQVIVHLEKTLLKPVNAVAAHPLFERIQKNSNEKSGVGSFFFRRQSWYGAFASVGVGDLVLVSQTSRNEVLSAIRTLLRQSALYGLLVITITFLVSFLFSKRLTRGLKELTQGAIRIKDGDLNTHIELTTRDELQILAESFNEMTTALKASRAQLEQYNQELEAKVAERTQQLSETNAQIKTVQEKLIRATQFAAIGEVAGRTAHEVLNPLTAILSRLERSHNVLTPIPGVNLPGQVATILEAWESDYSQGGLPALAQGLETPSKVRPDFNLFEEDLDNLKKLTRYWDDEQRTLQDDLDFVRNQAQRIQRIVDQMRGMVRAPSDQTEVHCHEALNEAISSMSDFLSKNQVGLAVDFRAAVDTAVLNRDELIQIVTNLIRNSYQAVAALEGGRREHGRIEVKTSTAEGNLYVDILDNGVGVPADKIPMLFEQGFTTKSPAEGTGLGLAICRRYARAFGGEVSFVHSDVTKGTCFRITVPLTLPDESRAILPSADEAVPEKLL